MKLIEYFELNKNDIYLQVLINTKLDLWLIGYERESSGFIMCFYL